SWIDSESFDSAGVSFTDSNDTPGPPVLTSVTDLNPCDSGVSIVFTASVEASSHDLYVDGSLQASGIISPHTYVPGDANSHDYVVRAINGTCYTNSNTSAGTDVNNTPGAPIISSVTDLYGCVLSGVSVVFSAGSGATSHDLYVDGSLQASGITSPYTYQPGDPSSHDYIIRGIYGLCWADSNTVAGIDFANANSSGELLSVDAIVGNMRSVCQGTFIQGSPTDEPCRIFNETQFIHTLTRNIAVMETEVTRQMWADLQAVQPTLPADPTNTSYGSGMSNPVNMPTWYETILFANLLSLQNGLDRCYYTDVSLTVPVDATNYTTSPIYCDFGTSGYRLLSEGEWEYAARALTTTPFSCNETNYTSENCGECTAGTHPTLEQYAVYCANEMGTSEPVGSKLPNPWNLSDMHGNVWEWCWDWNGTYPTGMTDHTGPISGTQRVLRGGSWEDEAHRSASRYSSSPNSRGYMFGFRLARSVN
ncbi:formylglycine-generating enzyme family protein, partial [bacterium]|nr:formylglycine-generating enzyme family protein [bacterium]